MPTKNVPFYDLVADPDVALDFSHAAMYDPVSVPAATMIARNLSRVCSVCRGRGEFLSGHAYRHRMPCFECQATGLAAANEVSHA